MLSLGNPSYWFCNALSIILSIGRTPRRISSLLLKHRFVNTHNLWPASLQLTDAVLICEGIKPNDRTGDCNIRLRRMYLVVYRSVGAVCHGAYVLQLKRCWPPSFLKTYIFSGKLKLSTLITIWR
jgi:hypothetical protein